MKGMLAACAGTALALVGATCAQAQDCKTAAKVTTVTPGTLTVAVYDYPPFSTTAAKDGKPGGIDVDIAQQVAKDSCLDFKTTVMDPAATIQAVVTGKADFAVGSWYRSEPRSKVVGLSYPTYIDGMAILSKDGTDSLEALVGKNVATVSGFAWVTDLNKLLGGKLKLYPSNTAMWQDIETGRLDAALDGYAGPAYAKLQGALKGVEVKLAKPDPKVASSIEPPQCAILYTKGDESLGNALNTTIKKMHEDGEMAKLISATGLDGSIANTGEPRLVK